MQNEVTAFVPFQSENVHKHRKENTFRRQLSLIDLSDGEEVACIRFYGKGSTSYACAWFHKSGQHARGSGTAGGYGYHRDSEAMQTALRVAGWTFRDGFGGVGEYGEQAALEAIARWLDVPRYLIHKAHA